MPSLPSSISAAVVITAATTLIAISISDRNNHRHEKKKYEARIAKLEETKQAERTGRIRAELKLRTALKNQQSYSLSSIPEELNGSSTNGTATTKNDALQLECIGKIVSPYTKRMGTPRQGALVPSGRGYIQLRIPVECVDGLDLYSHAWILFTFHANTDTPNKTNKSSTKKQQKNGNCTMMMNLTKTKIRPPRAPSNLKVGMLATRSPHRPNNIGLSLVQITSVDKKNKRLYINALDLVNGTPVYDVKPCVHWDVPGYYDIKNINCSSGDSDMSSSLKVPTWVSQDDTLKSVQFTSQAQEQLTKCIQYNKLKPLYTIDNDGVQGATNTICEILAQDPRASNSNGLNKRGSSSSSSSPKNKDGSSSTYKMIFCSVEIEFRVIDNGGKDGSSSEGMVIVENINDDLDLDNVEKVDGIPILLK